MKRDANIDAARNAGEAVALITLRLRALEGLIRAAQPVADRALLLHFTAHKPPCMGCPHVIWKQWRGHATHPSRKWQAHRVTQPLKHAPRRPETAAVVPLIREAVFLVALRSDLIRHLSALDKILSSQRAKALLRRKGVENSAPPPPRVGVGCCGSNDAGVSSTNEALLSKGVDAVYRASGEPIGPNSRVRASGWFGGRK